MGRREFLKTALLGLEAVLVAGGMYEFTRWVASAQKDSVFGISLDDDEKFSFDEMRAFAQRMDRLSERLPEPDPISNDEELQQWVREIVPMFEYNNFVLRAVSPKVAAFEIQTRGMAHNHILGVSNCRDYIHLNARMINPTSSWYGRVDSLFAVAHELAHVLQTEQICRGEPDVNVEGSAQIAALEVMSSLAVSGNRNCLAAVLWELRDMAIAAAFALAMVEKRTSEYMILRAELSPGAIAQSRFDRAMRYWEADAYSLKLILQNYSLDPLNRIMKALHGDGRVEGLAFPQIHAINRGSYLSSPELIVPKLDDLKYLLEHAEELTEEHTQRA